jgi:hypothetical protein
MQQGLNLIEETLGHFDEGAKSVKAYTSSTTYIITRMKDAPDFWVTVEEPGFPKTKVSKLDEYFRDVFGIEAVY